MGPRADIVATDIETDVEALAGMMAEATHSRMPIYRDQLDDTIGFVHIKDVLAAVRRRPMTPVRELVRDILFAAPSIGVLDLLLEMRARRTHMAIVVDEFGGVDGLITIEDQIGRAHV